MRKSAILSSVFVILALAIATRAQRSKCGPGRFECGDGECINGDKVCDGSADCRDGSDETEAECSKPEYMCPAYAFRCAYGACVDGDAPCNGKRDCVDNSDETLPRCLAGGGGGGGPSGSERRECARNEFKCNNGQCIPSSALCDGRTDCADKSDETAERCSELTCIEFLFRCNYGACVDGDAKCNGINDCADGSDEDPSMCRVQPGPVSPPTRTPPSRVSPTPPHRPAQFCPAPGQPPNGKRQLHRSLCPGRREECDVNEGTPIEPGNYLVYTCDAGYKLTGPSNVFCDAQGMWLNIPACIEIRCPSLNSASTQAHCIYRNKDGPCDNPVLPGTRAILSCRTSYQEDTKLLSSQRQVECNERGLWEPEPIRCYPGSLAIYVYINDNTISLETNLQRNKSAIIQVLEDRVVIYLNNNDNPRLNYPDIDVRMNTGSQTNNRETNSNQLNPWSWS